MDIAALIVWIVTAAGGLFLLGTWLAHGGTRGEAPTRSHLSAGVVFGHFLLAATGLVLWIVYLVTDTDALAWISFAVLLVVALLGFSMFFRWLPQVRRQPAAAAASGDATPEQRLPVALVALHGLLAATTLVLVLIAAAA